MGEKFKVSRFVDYFFCIGSRKFEILNENTLTQTKDDKSIFEINYKPQILFKYPSYNYPDMSLGSNFWTTSLQFFMGEGVSLYKETHPDPIFYAPILTLNDGERVYGGCLTIFEEANISQLLKIGSEKPRGEEKKDDLNISSPSPVYISKCLGVISHYPFFEHFRDFLLFIYKSINSNNFEESKSIERIIDNLLTQIPVPFNFLTQVSFKIGGNPSVIQPHPFVLDYPCILPFRGLSIENILEIYTGIITEGQILLISVHQYLLTVTCEYLLSLIFPLEWVGTYIPHCSPKLSKLLQSPVPYIIGMWMSGGTDLDIPNNSELLIVDLDENKVISGGRKRIPARLEGRLKKRLKEALSNVFSPRHPDLQSIDIGESPRVKRERRGVPVTRGNNICNNISPPNTQYSASGGEPPEEYSNPYLFPSFHFKRKPLHSVDSLDQRFLPSNIITEKSRRAQSQTGNREIFNLTHIRYAFIELFVNILSNFQDFITYKNERSISNPLDNSKTIRTIRPTIAFDREAFLLTKDIKERDFVRLFMETNLFTYWIQQYSKYIHEKPVAISFSQTTQLFITILKYIRSTPLNTSVDYSILDINVESTITGPDVDLRNIEKRMIFKHVLHKRMNFPGNLKRELFSFKYSVPFQDLNYQIPLEDQSTLSIFPLLKLPPFEQFTQFNFARIFMEYISNHPHLCHIFWNIQQPIDYIPRNPTININAGAYIGETMSRCPQCYYCNTLWEIREGMGQVSNIDELNIPCAFCKYQFIPSFSVRQHNISTYAHSQKGNMSNPLFYDYLNPIALKDLLFEINRRKQIQKQICEREQNESKMSSYTNKSNSGIFSPSSSKSFLGNKYEVLTEQNNYNEISENLTNHFLLLNYPVIFWNLLLYLSDLRIEKQGNDYLPFSLVDFVRKEEKQQEATKITPEKKSSNHLGLPVRSSSRGGERKLSDKSPLSCHVSTPRSEHMEENVSEAIGEKVSKRSSKEISGFCIGCKSSRIDNGDNYSKKGGKNGEERRNSDPLSLSPILRNMPPIVTHRQPQQTSKIVRKKKKRRKYTGHSTKWNKKVIKVDLDKAYLNELQLKKVVLSTSCQIKDIKRLRDLYNYNKYNKYNNYNIKSSEAEREQSLNMGSVEDDGNDEENGVEERIYSKIEKSLGINKDEINMNVNIGREKWAFNKTEFLSPKITSLNLHNPTTNFRHIYKQISNENIDINANIQQTLKPISPINTLYEEIMLKICDQMEPHNGTEGILKDNPITLEDPERENLLKGKQLLSDLLQLLIKKVEFGKNPKLLKIQSYVFHNQLLNSFENG